MWYTKAQKTLQKLPVGLCFDYAHGQYKAQVWAVTHPQGVAYVLADYLQREPAISTVVLLAWEPNTSTTQTGQAFKAFLYRSVHARGHWFEDQQDMSSEISTHNYDSYFKHLLPSQIQEILGDKWRIGKSETSVIGEMRENGAQKWRKLKGKMWAAAAPWGDVWISDVLFFDDFSSKSSKNKVG